MDNKSRLDSVLNYYMPQKLQQYKTPPFPQWNTTKGEDKSQVLAPCILPTQTGADYQTHFILYVEKQLKPSFLSLPPRSICTGKVCFQLLVSAHVYMTKLGDWLRIF